MDLPERDLKLVHLEQTLRLYRGGMVVCLLLMVVLLAALLGGGRHRMARAIRLDGQVVCLVNSRAAAQRVRDALLDPVRKACGGTVVLQEQWEDLDWPAGDNEVLTVEQAAQKLSTMVTPLVGGAAIRVDDQQALVLPSRDLADKTLQAVRAHFLKPAGQPNETNLGQQFANQVEISEVQVPASLVETDISRAVGTLLKGRTYTRSYTVRKGDSPERIARALGLPLAELERQVPSVAHWPPPGTKVQVPLTVGALKVITTKEVVVEKSYPADPQTVVNSALKPGERHEISPGQPGLKRIRARQTWQNATLLKSVTEETTIVTAPVPRRVEIGPPAGPGLTKAH